LDSQNNPPSLEGGDVIILSEKAVAIGFSERTEEKAIYHVAKSLIMEGKVERIYEVHLPKKRNFMHLDTVFTILDKNRVLLILMPSNLWKKFHCIPKRKTAGEQVHIKRTVLQEPLRKVLKKKFRGLEIIGTDKGQSGICHAGAVV
jgi:arginine deiminase